MPRTDPHDPRQDDSDLGPDDSETSLSDLFGDEPVPTRAQAAGTRRRTRKRRRIGWIVLAVVAVLILVPIGGAWWYIGRVAGSYDDQARKLSDEQVFDDGILGAAERAKLADKGTNILLLGSDSRTAGVDYSAKTGVRADTIMVAHLSDTGKGVQIIGIPRDLWVQVPAAGAQPKGTQKDGAQSDSAQKAASAHPKAGPAKINAALSWGGLPLTVATVEQFTQARIHHVAIIDFDGFKGLTDALGGVEVNSSVAFTSGGQKFVKGANRLDGAGALRFVRERKGFADGDLQRGRNQQAYLRAVFQQVVSAQTLRSPTRIAEVVDTFSPYLTVDSGLDSGTIGRLALNLGLHGTPRVGFATAPISGAGREGAQAVLYPDAARMDALRYSFAHDSLDLYVSRARTDHL
ncbi:LCP family protein [Brevibacterium moorei]|uniref:LCP family protein n=1 Tax=Brevibacterium moorei TaxID=2968457 RepID=UPI00211C24B0|nr:LCP family protein [Brevibacterium sp. 68QC2CO]